MADTNDVETTMKRCIERERNVFLTKLIEGKSSVEITQLLEELILDAVRALDEQSACQLLERYFVALVEVARGRVEYSGAEPSSYDGSRACAHVAMELWPKVHELGIGLRQPPEKVRAMLFEKIVFRWSITSDEIEADEIFRFIIGRTPYRSFEENELLGLIRKATGGAFKIKRAIVSHRILFDEILSCPESERELEWLHSISRILMISVARSCDVDEAYAMLMELADFHERSGT